MNPSPHFRFAKGLSGAILIGVVLACGYTFGKRIASAEAAVEQGTSPIQPGSTRQGSDTVSGQPTSSGQPKAQESNSDAPVGESLATGSGQDAGTEPSIMDAAHPDLRPVSSGSSDEGLRGDDVRVSDTDRLEFDATAYCLPGYSAAGIVTQRGMIAADPRILPLGSVVHILAGDYSGTYLVLDTGARIKGRRIDIYMPDRREAMSFGRRPVRVKVIGKVRPSHLQPR